MSRRPPNPAAERAAKNQATIKSLLKLEPNKMCSDCKRNKHPRWASWNLGVFICIRCSGIHRSMGVHISKVKSVDLDSWTDEQLQSVLNWGNARANKYWEAKLAPGHVPSEAKIENFIRTKYELKRWVMDGPMPDPSTLGADADDDVPLSIVKEKQTIERTRSLKTHPGQPSAIAQPAPQVDLIGGDDPIPRASTAGPVATKVPPKAEPAPPKSTSANNSLLGLDFLGSEPSPPPRPASTTGSGGVGGQSRPDLKQSILSLYATAPRPQQPSHGHSHSGSFGNMASPTAPPQMAQQISQPAGGGGLNDAFSNLSFSNLSSPRSPQNSAFSNLNPVSSNRSTPAPQHQQQQPSSSAFSGLSGGGFFDSKPAAAPSKPAAASSGFGGFGGFGDFSSPAAAGPPRPAAPASSAMNDLFDFSSPAPAAAPSPAAAAPSPSVFNLSQQPKSPPAPAAANNPLAGSGAGGGFSGADVWGGNAWADPAPAPSKPVTSPPPPSNDFGAWGSSTGGGSMAMGGSFANTTIVPGASGGLVAQQQQQQQPKVSADEEFGGWASSTVAPAGVSSGAGKGSEDLFSNVWE
ncbi:hypothetical protein KVR01_000385 [Diaporthe batatas]|uniref:uncharacterized protein n=1 Tax=Diaporthe batatas TaxID=748121 RepID=UPI001D05B737|nr:uncharacterized protein KVR01_000385 [Diaporthe batatas]KAG8169640.1 hypothetical protein KVR01_000385 [Diaporthe batatas]